MVLDFAVNAESIKDVPVVRVKGEIDIYTCPQLNKSLKEALEKGKKVIVLNLEHVQYIDSTGLGTIAHSAHALSKLGGKIHVVCTKPQVKKIFDVSGLSRKNINLYDEESGALNAVNG